MAKYNPDIILLDLGLPDGDGFAVIEAIRKTALTPIVVLSARGDVEGKVKALELGADDYVTKPFDMTELLARLKAALRHGLQAAGEVPIFRSGPLAVDLVHRRVTWRDEEIHLSPKEYGLLRYLVGEAGRVVTHQQILKEIWGPANLDDVQYLRVLMRQLRAKIAARAGRAATDRDRIRRRIPSAGIAVVLARGRQHRASLFLRLPYSGVHLSVWNSYDAARYLRAVRCPSFGQRDRRLVKQELS